MYLLMGALGRGRLFRRCSTWGAGTMQEERGTGWCRSAYQRYPTFDDPYKPYMVWLAPIPRVREHYAFRNVVGDTSLRHQSLKGPLTYSKSRQSGKHIHLSSTYTHYDVSKVLSRYKGAGPRFRAPFGAGELLHGALAALISG
jgi:hypothetical protein